MRSPRTEESSSSQQPHGLELRMQCELAAVRTMAGRVRAFLASKHVPEQVIWACELALVEGCNNAVQYASAATRKNAIGVEVRWSPEQVELRIRDENQPFSWPAQFQLPEVTEERGRGLYLIRSLMDRVEYLRDASSNSLVLHKQIQPS